jgi:NADH-quinone oxidoreductase subunit G
VILVSPDSSLEQIISIRSLAENMGATISGFSDGYIKKDDGDDYLIQDDKAANRAGLKILGIETSQTTFEEALAESTLLINFNNDLSLSYDETGLKNLFTDKQVIAVTSHDTSLSHMASLVLPVASYSEYSGTIINCDNILQTFDKAITKNSEPVQMDQIAVLLGGTLKSDEERYDALKKASPLLSDFTPDNIPASGLKLT